jgi:AcrR family transcriptional regulator
MPRTIKEEEYSQKRDEILAAMQRLVFSKGFERMTIGDIRDELKISTGAFFHYFPSKTAALEALIEKMQQAAEQPLAALVGDPALTASEKLQRYFLSLDQSAAAQKAFIARLAQVWFADENALLREKVDAALVRRRAPLLNAIVRQGIAEGAFYTLYPEQAGEIILALTRGMGNTVARRMLAYPQAPDPQACIDEIAATYAATALAVERLLGAAAPFLVTPDSKEIRNWLSVEENI